MVSGPSTRFRQDGTSSTESKVTLRTANSSFCAITPRALQLLITTGANARDFAANSDKQRGAGVARCESQLLIPLLETGSENTAQQQPQEQQQQFETEEHWMVVEAFREVVEMETRGEEQEDHLQPPKQQQQLQSPAAPPPVWTSHLVIPLLETGSESTAQQQPQEQQQQYLDIKGQRMVVDAGKKMVEFETGEKGWLDDLVVKLNYEPYLPCSVEAAGAEPIDVWARSGIGTRWLVAVESAGCGRHGHLGGEPFPPFAPH